jgi:hypothetical protein
MHISFSPYQQENWRFPQRPFQHPVPAVGIAIRDDFEDMRKHTAVQKHATAVWTVLSAAFHKPLQSVAGRTAKFHRADDDSHMLSMWDAVRGLKRHITQGCVSRRVWLTGLHVRDQLVEGTLRNDNGPYVTTRDSDGKRGEVQVEIRFDKQTADVVSHQQAQKSL